MSGGRKLCRSNLCMYPNYAQVCVSVLKKLLLASSGHIRFCTVSRYCLPVCPHAQCDMDLFVNEFICGEGDRIIGILHDFEALGIII